MVCCLNLVYPRYNPNISMTYDILHMVCYRNSCLCCFGRMLCSPSPISVRCGEPSDALLEKCWVVRPQLFFTCHLRPRNGRPQKRANLTQLYVWCRHHPSSTRVLQHLASLPILYILACRRRIRRLRAGKRSCWLGQPV